MAQKYVRLKCFDGMTNVIFTFPDTIDHSKYVQMIGSSKDNVASAGFVSFSKSEMGNPTYNCYGRSVSLDIDSIPEEDNLHLNYQIYNTFDTDEY